MERCVNVTAEEISKKLGINVSTLTHEELEQVSKCKTPSEIDSFLDNLVIKSHGFFKKY